MGRPETGSVAPGKEDQDMKMVPAFLDLILGIGLLLFPESVVGFFGLPDQGMGFWSSLLGAVFLGMGITALVDAFKDSDQQAGPVSTGAVTINLCASLVLAGWLLGGKLDLTTRSSIILWGLVLVLAGVSALGIRTARTAG